MTIGDQVKNLEQEYDAAVALADSLATQCDALKSANAVLEKQLALRTSALADTESHMAEALQMVDAVAVAALNMLKCAKRPMGTPSAIVGARVIADSAPLVPVLLTDDMLAEKAIKMYAADAALNAKQDHADLAAFKQHFPQGITGLKDNDPIDSIAPAASFASQVAGDIMAADDKIVGDSGDEMVDLSPIKRAIEEKLASPDANCVTQADGQCVAEEPCMHTPEPIAPPVELDAVDRMRRDESSASLLPPATLMRAPIERGPQLAINNDRLPIFLARDTVFQRGDAIFS